MGIEVDTESFFVIVVVAALAAVTVAVVPKRLAPPVVVLELMAGIVVGPEVLNLAHTDEFIEFFSNLGLGMLFFFAGYEIDFQRIKGKPMKLGAWGWLLSIALAYGIGGLLAAAGVVVSFLYTGSAMATTATCTPPPRPAWSARRCSRRSSSPSSASPCASRARPWREGRPRQGANQRSSSDPCGPASATCRRSPWPCRP